MSGSGQDRRWYSPSQDPGRYSTAGYPLYQSGDDQEGNYADPSYQGAGGTDPRQPQTYQQTYYDSSSSWGRPNVSPGYVTDPHAGHSSGRDSRSNTVQGQYVWAQAQSPVSSGTPAATHGYDRQQLPSPSSTMANCGSWDSHSSAAHPYSPTVGDYPGPARDELQHQSTHSPHGSYGWSVDQYMRSSPTSRDAERQTVFQAVDRQIPLNLAHNRHGSYATELEISDGTSEEDRLSEGSHRLHSSTYSKPKTKSKHRSKSGSKHSRK